MHGPGYAPPPGQRPSNAALVTLRVVFVVLTIGTCGLLSFAPMLRLALVTKKGLDWALFVAAIVLGVGSLIAIGAEPTEDVDTTQEWLGLLGMVLTVIGVITYYLYADIKHFHGWSGPATLAHPGARKQPPAYGYPAGAPTMYGQAAPYQGAPHQAAPHQSAPHPGVTAPMPPAHQQPMHHQPLPQQPQQPIPTPPPAPQRPAPARIDQVRAELDELSSFLRGSDEPTDGRDFPPRERRPEDNR
ncbi:hypothetical protein ACIBI4_13300 [Streptomyces sp. NPDC050418]|uniref:hypothetical protein n=1 Tax=Streptomyces sp. NPDC050418 TaxID=3365612 RepID=UPI0037A35A64